jgi:hypothetical protein
MGPNDAQLVRVFTREAGGAISDETAEKGSALDIVVEAEAGFALHSTGGRYEFGIVVRNLTTSSSIHTDIRSGLFGDANWPADKLANQFVFTLPAAMVTAALAKNIFEVIAYLMIGGVGPTPPDVSFEKSSMFIVH